MSDEDHRRRIPRTDRLLALPAVREARERIGDAAIRRIVEERQRAAREGRLPVEEVEQAVVDALRAERPASLVPVLNATGVIVHTNLGRAPLSEGARQAIGAAAGYVDVEMDLVSGKRSARGAGAREALLQACPEAEDALIVNNGAAALLLAVTAVCAGASERDRAIPSEMIVSRGELVEIGAGFRLPDLLVTPAARGRHHQSHAPLRLRSRDRRRDRLPAEDPPEQLPRAGVHLRGRRSGAAPTRRRARAAARRRPRQRPAATRPAAARRA
jgi:L-seryl-tRNA(Ser) seleniumtransferase